MDIGDVLFQSFKPISEKMLDNTVYTYFYSYAE